MGLPRVQLGQNIVAGWRCSRLLNSTVILLFATFLSLSYHMYLSYLCYNFHAFPKVVALPNSQDIASHWDDIVLSISCMSNPKQLLYIRSIKLIMIVNQYSNYMSMESMVFLFFILMIILLSRESGTTVEECSILSPPPTSLTSYNYSFR